MKKHWSLFCLILIVGVVSVLVLPEAAYAAPGGMIVKAAAKTWYGKVFAGIVFIILLPIGLYVLVVERMARTKAKKALTELAKVNKAFRWTALRERAYEVVTQVYSAWKKSDVVQAKEWMTAWYWQNQKITVLDEWESEGLSNYCKLNAIQSIDPLYVEYTEETEGDGEGSRIVLSVEVSLVDYLVNDSTGEVVKGDKKEKLLESLWTLVLEEGQWKLTLIEEGSVSLHYARMKNNLEAAHQHVAACGKKTTSFLD